MEEKKKRTDYSKKSKRTASTGVRFDKESLERLMKERGLKTIQQATDFLMKLYDDSFHPSQILLNPVLQRNAERSIPAMEESAKVYGFPPFGAEEVPVLDFGDSTFLQVEKFTKYPLHGKPTNKLEALRYMEKKNAYDKAIRQQWLDHKNRKGI